MKIATLYRKDGKVILETDNDAIAQVATGTPQDVVVMDPYERMAAHYFTGERQVGRPAALAAPYGQNVPPHGVAEIDEVRERLAAISGVAGARVSAESDDIRALLAAHAQLQAECLPKEWPAGFREQAIDSVSELLNNNNGKIGKRRFMADSAAAVNRVMRAVESIGMAKAVQP